MFVGSGMSFRVCWGSGGSFFCVFQGEFDIFGGNVSIRSFLHITRRIRYLTIPTRTMNTIKRESTMTDITHGITPSFNHARITMDKKGRSTASTGQIEEGAGVLSCTCNALLAEDKNFPILPHNILWPSCRKQKSLHELPLVCV